MPFRARPPFAAFEDAAAAPPDWSALCALVPELSALEACPQDPEHHGEGDVAAHTRMVLAALQSGAAWAEAGEAERTLLFWTAALHDIGKPATTRREGDGRLRAPGHARLGARMARRIFWEVGAPPIWREAVARLIGAHMRPFHLIDAADPRRAAIEIAEGLAGAADARRLLVQAAADAAGRLCHDAGALADRTALAGAVFEEHGLLERPWPFANGASRAAYFAREGRDPFYADIAPRRARATLLSGLPGVGKDRWIAEHGAGRPVVSLDAIRRRVGARPTGAQGAVVAAAVLEAKGHLRAGRPFIWNATNLTRALRAAPLALFRDYAAAVEIVYLEAGPAVLRAQNAGREAAIPEKALDKLADKVEPPDGREADLVRWILNGELRTIAG